MTNDLSPPQKLRRLTPSEWEQFQRDGFLISRQLVPTAIREQMLAVTLDDLQHERGPIEYEAELHYPGAPQSLKDERYSMVKIMSRDTILLDEAIVFPWPSRDAPRKL